MLTLSYRHLLLGDFEGALVGLLGLVHDFLAVVASGDLGQVAEVIALHFQVEDLRLPRG